MLKEQIPYLCRLCDLTLRCDEDLGALQPYARCEGDLGEFGTQGDECYPASLMGFSASQTVISRSPLRNEYWYVTTLASAVESWGHNKAYKRK